MKKIRRKIKKSRKFFALMLLVFILSCVISFSLCVILSPKIEISDKNITLLVGDEFKEPDYKAMVKNQDVTEMVHKKGVVNVHKIGTYTLEYDIKYSIFEDKKIVIVNVVDTEKPVIELVGGEEVLLCPNTEYKELGYKASDNYDGDITSNVKVIQSEDEVIYGVMDSSGNKTDLVRKIKHGDIEKPVITLNGDSYITIYVNNSYREPGYKASDNCDGDITSLVDVSGVVNTKVVGKYQITYHVSDKENNEVSVQRTVNVIEKKLIRPQGGGSGRGIVYLTFDDGPNEGTTNVILDVLKEEGVSATFFVTCNGPDYLIKRMFDEGHTVALHTASHNYSYVYSSEANYFADLERVSSRVERITGQRSMILRFPGGSSNTVSRFNPGIMSRLTKEVLNRGYHYFDWNVDSNDAAGASSSGIYSNVINNISLNRENVVLMHDIKTTTREAIRSVIRSAKEEGFVFRRITNDTVMVTHSVNN